MGHAIQHRRWQQLGEALRALREARDLAQKQVVDRSGEDIGERTLRTWESGEQRPSRHRLLKLAVQSFELKSVPEINSLLQLAKYASLSDNELRQYGLHIAVTGSDGGRSAIPTGPPAGFRIEVSAV